MAGQPYFPLYVGDWKKDPEVLDLDAEGRALWLEMHLLMHESNSGTLKETTGGYAKKCSLLYEQVQTGIDQIESSGVANVTHHADGTITVVCRRIEKELHERKLNRERQRRYRERHSGSEDAGVTDNDDITDSTKSSSRREALHNAANNGQITSFTESDSENEVEIEKKGVAPNYEAVEDSWNEFASDVGLPQIRKMTKKRRAAVRSKYEEIWPHIEEIYQEIRGSPFLLGEGGRESWRGATFDFIWIREDHHTRILEGAYSGKQKNGRQDETASERFDRLYHAAGGT